MLGANSDLPCTTVAPAYVVRNTFVEVVDGENTDHVEDLPPFRRRRGSSFFRSSSAPARGRSKRRECKEEALESSTEDEGSDGISTPSMSRASSRAVSPSASPMYANPPDLSQSLTAAVQASYTTGVFAANAPHVCAGALPFYSAPVQMGQLPLFETCQIPFAFAGHGPVQFQPQAACDLSPVGQHSSNSSEAGGKQACHFIWCDHRAFKDTASTLKNQLERGSGVTVKTHKTAENCIRLFRKKQRAQGRPPCVILVSWANAPSLLSYLADADHVTAKVIVLCDSRSCRKNESADELAAQFPFISKIATTWDEAVESACRSVAAFN